MGKIIAGLVVIIGLVWFITNRSQQVSAPSASDMTQQKEKSTAESSAQTPVKEFSMTSYYDETGKWFSEKNIAVKKGDRVRIKVTNTKGMHDFVIDEYAVKQETPLNEETVIEFTADKTGEFVYYCSKPGHRDGGQWGTLTVTE